MKRSSRGSSIAVFFFQAEDGIRDDLVTGVQTCALPILVVAVNNSVPAKSLAELIALDKSQPGKLAAADEGAKTFGGMMSQGLNIGTGMRLLQVPYNGVAPALQDTVAGRRQVVLRSEGARVGKE